MSDAKKALNEQDAITAAHLQIKATLTTLEKALAKNSFDLRQFEAVIAEARAKGRLDQMQVNAKSVAGLVQITRNSFDATTMLLDRCRRGLADNEAQRDRIIALEAELAKRDGVLAGV
jgi:hypothetical protein